MMLLSVTPPGASCATALTLTLGEAASGSIAQAGRVWYRITGLDAGTNYRVTIESLSNGIIGAGVYTSCQGNAIVDISDNSSSGGGTSGGEISGSTTYYIRLYDGGLSAAGSYNLTFETDVSYLFQDTFTDTNGTNLESHTPNTGTWAVSQTAKMTIQSNACKQTAAYAPDQVYAFVDGGVGTADHTIEVDITLPNSGGNFPTFFMAIQGRNQAESGLNGWNYVISEDGPVDTTLSRKGFAANGATVSNASSYSFTPGQTFTLKIVFSGNNITSYIDGVQDVSFTSSTHNTDVNVGFCAYYDNSSYTGVATIDNFLVYES